MVRLERNGNKVPRGWAVLVERAFGRCHARYVKRAMVFEALALTDARRQGGFKAFAPDALPRDSAGACDFPPVWREAIAKDVIRTLSDGHCAYCQSSVAANQPGDVEHFKPKALFPTRAYRWGNYFYSCSACNNAKRARWPVRGSFVRPDSKTRDPYERFVFHEDGRVGAAPGDRNAARTVKALRLNRKELVKDRECAIRLTVSYARNALKWMKGETKEAQRSAVRTLLMEPLARFSAAINQNVRRVWQEAWGDALG